MVYLYDLGYLGMIECLQEICNLSIIFSRYRLIYKDDSILKKYFVAAFIFLLLLCTWVPFYTVVPIFVNTNENYVIHVSEILYVCVYFPAVVLYHAYFTGSFVLAIRRLLRDDFRDGMLLLMAKKSLIHSTLR